jgi:hypothetical protein
LTDDQETSIRNLFFEVELANTAGNINPKGKMLKMTVVGVVNVEEKNSLTTLNRNYLPMLSGIECQRP